MKNVLQDRVSDECKPSQRDVLVFVETEYVETKERRSLFISDLR